ncbi:hypothetical protein ACIOD1_12905 [Streptomyces sp. NPDC088097]|uniref:hypothetical protein n=1 Tax=Streptomyces sp. NPDC088097 TaxID=3365823 RepID=UPI0038237166
MTLPNATSPTAPERRQAAVYRLFAADDTLLYIGSAYDPEQRCIGHHDKPWWPQVARRTEEWHPSRGAAYAAEMAAVAVERAKYNVMGAPGARSDAMRRRDEMARVRGQVIAEMHRVQNQAMADLRAAGGSWREARDVADAAGLAFLEESGLFPAWVARQKAHRAAE